MKKITALAIENWQPTAVRQEVLLGDGLYFIVQRSGEKSWALRYRRRSDGKPVKHTLGRYPAITLKAARAEAIELRAEIARGSDPHGAKIAVRKQREAGTDTFEAAARRYVASYQFKQNRSWEWCARLLGLAVDVDTQVEPGKCPPLVVKPDGGTIRHGQRSVSLADRWGHRRLADITDADVIAVLEELTERAPIAANRLLAVLKKFFAWARSAKLVAINPCAELERPAPEQSRERVLSDFELVKIWRAADQVGHPYCPIVRLLILTGQRRNEIAGLRWSEIDVDERVIHLPKERCKNNQPNDVPLSAKALAIIAGMSRDRLVDVDHCFTIKRKPARGFSDLKEKLDAASGVSGWTLHDVRRTVASGLQRLAVRIEVTEAVLNHRSGKVSGIAAIYQRHSYADEKRDALARWGDHVDAIVSGRKANVVTLREAVS
jgi:integrase